ncbi:MAG TPA: nucleotidyltransferase family protein, partial [Bacillota bacterium]|nr:nucleotidyltransferase family protein [Bacillota bacterium]
MQACGLIVEYNPFHNGHLFHIEKAKEISQAECIVAVMSGPFLQRGEPSIIDKYHRTMAALENGVDVVVELPFPYAVESSHLFAVGSVKTLHKIGVSSICFGSES